MLWSVDVSSPAIVKVSAAVETTATARINVIKDFMTTSLPVESAALSFQLL